MDVVNGVEHSKVAFSKHCEKSNCQFRRINNIRKYLGQGSISGVQLGACALYSPCNHGTLLVKVTVRDISFGLIIVTNVELLLPMANILSSHGIGAIQIPYSILHTF